MGDAALARDAVWWMKLKLIRHDEYGEYIYVCPDCIAKGIHDRHCNTCYSTGELRLFACEGCGNWTPWSEGAADDCPNYCDTCWNNQDRGRPV